MQIVNFTKDELKDYIQNYINVLFKIPVERERLTLEVKFIDMALERIEYCFERINIKYYKVDGETIFNPMHGDHLASFLWFLADTYATNTQNLCIPVCLCTLNKLLHGVDLHYKVRMPEVFLLVHPIGSVIGAAKYEDYLVIYQNCTIGSKEGKYPTVGKYCVCYSNTSVLGEALIGENVVIAANTLIISNSIPSNSIACGSYPNTIIKPNRTHNLKRVFELEK